MSQKLALILGIRPDVIRAAEIIKLLDDSPEVNLTFIWSGQHYSDNLKDIFFRELNVRKPDIELGAKGSNDGELSADVIKKLYDVLNDLKPAVAIFLGDTNTVIGCLAAAQLNIPIYHIEGGMRSFDWRMIEEKYRTITDHLSDVIYAYLPKYKQNALNQGIPDKCVVLTQNPIVDIIQNYFKKVDVSKYFNNKIKQEDFVLLTCHRRENVTSKEILQRILSFCKTCSKKILFPAGYRTQNSIKEFNLKIPENVFMIDPIGYLDFLNLMKSSKYVLTDSGTVVEEACILGIPTVQIRKSTERPEVYEVNSSVKLDPSLNSNESSWREVYNKVESLIGTSWKNPFGDGHASVRIANDIIGRAKKGSMRNKSFNETDELVKRAFQGENNGF